MGAKHGSRANLRLGDSGGTLRDLSAYLTDTGMPRSGDTAEVSTLGATSKSYIAGLKDGTIPLGGPFDPTADGYLAGILAVEGRAFQYQPQGPGTGNIQYTGTGILTAYEVSAGMGGASTFTGTFQISGDVTRTVL